MRYLLLVLIITACSNTTSQPTASNPNSVDCVEVASLFENGAYMYWNCLKNK